jgi:hypothetical protein
MIRLLRLFVPIAALVTMPVAAQQTAPAPISLEHRMLLRCSAAFALVSHRQSAGDPAAAEFPPLVGRGSEFFIRASAQVMDEARLDRAAIAAALTREAETLLEPEALRQAMPSCLAALESSGL